MAVYAGPDLIEDGLIFCIDPGNPKSWNGSSLLDIAGNRSVSLVNTSGSVISYANDNGGILKFNGGSNYIQCPSDSQLKLTNSFTMFICYRLNQAFGDQNLSNGDTKYRTLFGKPNYNEYGIIMEWYTNNPLLFDFIGTDNVRNPLGLTYTNGYATWSIVAYTYDSSRGFQKSYIYRSNGTTSFATRNTTSTIRTNDNPVRIGSAGAGYELNMDVGPALIYNKALTDSEIQQNFERFRNRYGI